MENEVKINPNKVLQIVMNGEVKEFESLDDVMLELKKHEDVITYCSIRVRVGLGCLEGLGVKRSMEYLENEAGEENEKRV